MKVDRHTKTKKSIFCNLEIFQVRDKDFPVEVVEHKGSALRQLRLGWLTMTTQTPSWIFRGSQEANDLLLCHRVTRTSETLDPASPLRLTSASTSLNEARETSNSFVSQFLSQVHSNFLTQALPQARSRHELVIPSAGLQGADT